MKRSTSSVIFHLSFIISQFFYKNFNISILKELFFNLGLILLFAACNSTKNVVPAVPKGPETVKFTKSDKLMPILADAKAQNKLVFVDFYTTWCLPCKLMDEDVFTDEDLAKYMNENFINYKVDAEGASGANLALLYQVVAFPTLLFLDVEGNVLVRKVGAAYQTELKSMGDQAISEAALATGE